MTATAQHSAIFQVRLGDDVFVLPVERLDLTADEESYPYIVGSVTVPAQGAVLNIDPTDSIVWFELALTRTFGRTDKIRDLTRRYRDRALSFITAAFTGQDIDAITRSLYHDYDEEGADRRDRTRVYTLVMRGIEHDELADTVTIDFASGDSALMDTANMDTNGTHVPGADMIAKTNWLLARLGFGPLDVTPVSVNPSDAALGDDAIWATGQTIWDCIQQMTRRYKLQLWCTGDAEWILSDVRARFPTARTLTSTGTDRTIVNAVTRRSRDRDWYTAVAMEYDPPKTEDDDPAPVGADYWDVAVLTANGPHKVKHYRINHEKRANGRAEGVLDKITGQGRASEILAVSEYNFNTGDPITIITSHGSRTGRCTSIRWQLPQDEMSLRLRDVTA